MNNETLKRQPLSSAYRNSTAVLPWMLCAATLVAAGPAYAGGALPTNGQYVAGQGSISSSAGNVTVHQTSSHGIINWQNFSIGQGNSVLFNNGSGATLNRVTGNQISQIDGSLKATGSVYLINPQGIVIGPSGQVIANGSFVASTRDVDNNAFMSGQAFSASGTSNGSIINQGVITSNTGDAILVGSAVTNTGSIFAPNGTVGLAAGNQITLQPVGTDARIAISGGRGSVTNSGNLKAAQAELNAAGGNVYALVENNGGAISATGTQTINGHVWLTAGGTGTVTVAGAINAQNANGSGGDVTVRGYNISLPGAVNAFATTANGNGGNVSVVASNSTTVSGAIHAGGGASGHGGSIETSGHTLSFGGANIDAGKGGNWLLDPFDLTVTSSAATTIDTSLNAGTSVTLQTTATGTSGPGTANSSGTGNINIDAPLSWNTSATLTLNAYASIVFAANVSVANGGGLVMVTNSGGKGGDYFIDQGDSIEFPNHGTLKINGNTYTLAYSVNDIEGDANGASEVNNTNLYIALAMPTNASGYGFSNNNQQPIGYYINFGGGSLVYEAFSGTFTGLGNTISNLHLTYNSQFPLTHQNALFGYSNGTIRNVELVNEVISGGYAAGLVSTNAGLVEYVSASGSVSGSYTGGLTFENTGTIRNSSSSVSVSATGQAGGLAYYNPGTIASSYATGSVTANQAGGLVSDNNGTITNSYATGAVTGAGDVGGLVGFNDAGGNISQSYATGFVTYTGGGAVGGLVGFNNNTNSAAIINDYWDTTTSAQGNALGGGNGGSATGFTTTQFQNGSLPSGLPSGAWATGTGLYPYLTGIFPSGVTAISGTVENTLGTATQAGAKVGVDVGGNLLATVTSGANGYFYAIGQAQPAGSVALAYANGDSVTYIPSLTTSGASNVVILNDMFSYATSATALSQINLGSIFDPVAANDGAGLSAIANAQGLALFDSGASFTIDGPFSGNLTVKMSAANAPITVSQPITLLGAEELTLDATGGLTINANVLATGANQVSLVTGASGYSLGFGDSISFTGGSTAGASLAINGNPYTLIYSMGQLQTINSALGGDYALATSLNAATDLTTPATWTPIAGSQTFTGIFEGLGNTVSNLSASGVNGGLFAVSSGTIRDVGVIGGTFTGSVFAGGLVGQNFGLVENSYATANVNAPDAGGLVGYNTGTLVNDEARGSVSGSNPGNGIGGVSAVGGLVGYNTNAITLSFATGAVNAGNYAGGLAGENIGGTIGNSFAMGAVSGTTDTGGLAGNNTGTIGNAYATGYIMGSGRGGLVGTGGGAVTDSFWDSGTTGVGGGDTTAQLQGALPGTFSSSVWSTGTGLYPYLTNFFGNGIAAVSGTAYTNAGTTALTDSAIGVDVNGSLFASATTGANGYYYAFGAPIASGANALAYVKGGDAATLANNIATSGVAGVNIFGNTLSETTSASLLSQLSGNVQSLANAAATNDASGLAAIAAAPNVALLDSAASFTVDQAWTPSSSLTLQMTAANAPIIVASPITLTGTKALALDATGNITFNADVTVTGGGALSFANGTGDSYSLTFGDNIAFTGGASSGASLTINGTPYTLIYSMGQLQNVNAKVSGDYALATSLNAATDLSTPASWTPIGNLFTVGPFTGVFEGLGNTISNLTVNTNGANYTGLFSYLSGGTIRDVGLIGGSVTGGNYTGGLAGYNGGGSIIQSYATGNVAGGNNVGGLVGKNTGTITLSYANGNVSGANKVGGLGGYNSGTINETYATGIVSSSNQYPGSGGYVGGLVGESGNGSRSTISNSFATGNVNGNYAGGLVGGARLGTITNSYSIGTVSGGYHGPFSSDASGTNTYYNSDTGGASQLIQGASTGATGLTTAQLQGVLPTGFSSSIWSTGTGLYPYLTALFPNGIAVVSGTTNSGTVTVDVNGKLFGSVPSAANETYYIFGQPLAAGSSLLVYDNVVGNTPAAVYIGNPVTSGANTANFSFATSGSLTTTSPATTYSGLVAAIDAAAGSDANALAVIANATALDINATGTSFTLDKALTIPGAVTINATGSLAFDADVTMTGGGALSFSAGGGNYSIAPGTNVSFTAPEGSGQSLTIDGTRYQLIYSMLELQSINISSNLNGHYALATSLNAATDPTTPASWTPLGTSTTGGGTVLNTSGFSGVFEGLGNTVSNLTVNMASSNTSGAGLFGYSSGTIRDVGLINTSVTGGYEVGALTGANTSTGTITNSYAAGGTTNGVADVGALVGYNQGSIGNSFATGAVTGSVFYVGGLVGYSVGTISSSYATGAVSAPRAAGGLVGFNNGTINNDYAMGAVSATGSYVGGLVGDSGSSGAISSSYATGAVSGAGDVGGLAGGNSGTISSSAWNKQTTGQSGAVGLASGGSVSAAGDTTAQLQGTLPSGFSSTVWSTGSGLYPYLTSFFSHGIAVVSGTAYSDAGTTPLSDATVGVDTNGSLFATASTGVNGYYYAFGQPIASGSDLTVYTNANTGGTNAAVYLLGAATASSLFGVNVDGNAFTATTPATSYSSLLTAAAGNDANAQSAINNAANANITATGAGFTVDQANNRAGNFTLTTTGTNAAIDIVAPLTASTATLTATGGVAFNGDVTITGNGAFTISTGGAGYSVGEDDSVTFTAPEGSGASLTIDGTNYTLLYTAADLAAINSALNGTYALAGAIDASSIANWTPLGTNGHGSVLNANAGFTGTLAGLGNTVSNLTVNTGTANEAGFFGVNSGMVRDVNISNVHVTGGSLVGGLVGFNQPAGTLQNDVVYEGGSIAGASQVGGLVGWNDGTIVGGNVWTANVSGTGAGIGGFVGLNQSTGSISGASVTGNNASGTLTTAGTVNGISSVGGFAGGNFGTLSNDQASDLIVSSTTGWVGGFVGWNTNSITTSSASNIQVIGTSGVGGFVGENTGMISQSDAQTAILNGATAAVSGTGSVGGFAGTNEAAGTISNATSSSSAEILGMGNNVGGFAGANLGQLGSDSFTGGSVAGVTSIGGFVGVNSGTVSDAQATASVTGSGSMVGGLVGWNKTTGSITDGTFTGTGTISGVNQVGGFVGWNDGMVLGGQAFAVDVVGTGAGIGGFVGLNESTGSVLGASVTGNNAGGTLTTAGTINGTSSIGGFAGGNFGTLSNDQASDIIVGSTSTGWVGGFVGWNTNSIITSSASNIQVIGASGVGGFVGENTGAITQSSTQTASLNGALSAVSGTHNVGGFAGTNEASGSISNATSSSSAEILGTGNNVGGFAGANLGHLGSDSFTGDSVAGVTSIGGFAGVNSGTITSAQATASVTGSGSMVGGLVGWNKTTGSITDGTFTGTGTISGVNQVGGFVGWNDGMVSGGQAFAVDVVGTGAGIGGFVGLNETTGSISGASVTGNNAGGTLTTAGTVNGVSSVGGFAGGNFGTLSNDQASDIIVGSASTSWVGGFVGWNTNSITTSSAKDVQVIGISGVGGFVGENTGMIQQSDAQAAILNGATAAVSGTGSVGGFAGTNEAAGSLTNVYATGSVSGAAQAFVGGLVGVNNGTVSDAYADDIVTGPAGRTGAVVGDNGTGASVTDTYYDAALTGTLPAVGLSHGATGIAAMGGPGQPDPTQASTYVGFDFANVWTIAAGDLPTLTHAP